MTKNKYTIKSLKPEEDSLGLDTKAKFVFVQIESNKDDTIKYEAITPEKSIKRLNTYDNVISRLTAILEKPIDKESEIYIELTLYKRKREKLIVGISEFEATTGKLLLDKNHKVLSGINKSYSSLKNEEAFDLLKRLENPTYVITESDNVILKHKSFTHWSSVYMKKHYPIEIFDSAYFELSQNKRLNISKFYQFTNPPSKWYEEKFLNIFIYHCNRAGDKYNNNKEFLSPLKKRINNKDYLILMRK